ncbi:MAG TPA: aminotransferase class V-fold PLP-dependent enzyme [Kofleriaceae bacterium]|nr:aminotransferase class V-fold PLP-dependent enzyme [Kofleriaceae bacterium]
MARPIYMDNQATTRVDPRVLEAMLPWFSEEYGNAASKSHAFGWAAEAAVDRAREQLAGVLEASPAEIEFTSGATEANNLALLGAARAARAAGGGDHLVTVATEHKSVLDVCRHLEGEGFRVSYLPPGADGLITPEAVAAAVEPGTALVSVMLVNNEIGVVQPVAAIAAAVKSKSPATLVHCDAAQALGKLPLTVPAFGVDLIALSAHKVYGPKGIGALWVRRRPRVRLEPILHGGGHERGLRPGTLPVPLIVGFGAATALAAAGLADEAPRIAGLRDRLLAGITGRVDGVTVNGSLAQRVAGNLNLSFAGVDGEALLMSMRDVAVSSGSACTSASLEPSYVLRALGVDDELAHASIRFGIGRFNTEAEIDRTIELVAGAVTQLRAALGTPVESHVG